MDILDLRSKEYRGGTERTFLIFVPRNIVEELSGLSQYSKRRSIGISSERRVSLRGDHDVYAALQQILTAINTCFRPPPSSASSGSVSSFMSSRCTVGTGPARFAMQGLSSNGMFTPPVDRPSRETKGPSSGIVFPTGACEWHRIAFCSTS